MCKDRDYTFERAEITNKLIDVFYNHADTKTETLADEVNRILRQFEHDLK